MNKSVTNRRLWFLPLVAFLSPVEAATSIVTSGSASGLGMDVDLSLLVLDVGVGPFAEADVSAPSPDTDSAQVLGLNVDIVATLVTLGSVQAAALDASASSNIDGFSATGNSTGAGSVTGLSFSLGTGGLISLSTGGAGDVISSTSSSSGSYGSLSSIGTSTLENVTLNIGSTSFNLSSTYSPNTELNVSAAGVAGVRVFLNEQTVSGDGISDSYMTTNAIRIDVDAVDLGGSLGIVSGDIIIGQSMSGLDAIPEPQAAVSIGLAGMLLLLRRRKS
ncbi:hypothetical protein ACFPK9_12530 [Rubritalea spongiae]|uniref:PEP-CTERM sorting domain-containing protein n=1 Tax=Rubritalea spongiae TaxID=430797 RepID=A0ABW5E319_9BACT